MHNIIRKLNAITETVATDVMFTGFRTIMRDGGGSSTEVSKGPDIFTVSIVDVDNPRIDNGVKIWQVQLHCECELVAYAFADEHDL